MATAIILNGTELNIDITEARIVCADGGFRLLKERVADIIVGDFDSLGEIPEGIKTLKVPAEKNFSDGEMALKYVKELGETEVAIYGATGGRIDHVFANFALLKLAFCLHMHAKIKSETFVAEYVEGTVVGHTKIGAMVSFIPFGGDILVKQSRGLQYPLKNLLVTTEGMSRSISNVATATEFCVEIAKGGAILICYQK